MDAKRIKCSDRTRKNFPPFVLMYLSSCERTHGRLAMVDMDSGTWVKGLMETTRLPGRFLRRLLRLLLLASLFGAAGVLGCRFQSEVQPAFGRVSQGYSRVLSPVQDRSSFPGERHPEPDQDPARHGRARAPRGARAHVERDRPDIQVRDRSLGHHQTIYRLRRRATSAATESAPAIGSPHGVRGADGGTQ